MALYPYQAGLFPLGQFDAVDGYLTTIKGGEIGTITTADRRYTTTEKAAADVYDGYDNTSSLHRIAVWNSIGASTTRPLWLLDEGTTGYGTLFGQVIGTPAGLSTTGTNLGPHTAAASGKVTCWDKPGVYAISLDAVDVTNGGLLYSEASCTPGHQLDVMGNHAAFTGNGKITLSNQSGAIGVNVGRFLEFEVSPFKVTTPVSLLSASQTPIRVVIYYSVNS